MRDLEADSSDSCPPASLYSPEHKAGGPAMVDSWDRLRKSGILLDIGASDPALQPAARRLLARLAESAPTPDPDADTLLLALSMSRQVLAADVQAGSAAHAFAVAGHGAQGAATLCAAARRLKVSSRWDCTASAYRHAVSADPDDNPAR